MKLAKPAVNPVLARELRQRMRGPRAAVVLTVYLSLLVIILQLLYAALAATSDFRGPVVEEAAGVGRTIFHTLLFFVLALVCFIVPSVTAAAITSERERQTLVPLQVTLLRARQILTGKLLASVAFVVLLIVATLPLAGVSFLLGGIEPFEVARATAMVLVSALVLAAISLWCSTYLRTTAGATVVAMAMTFALCVGTFMAYGTQRVLDRGEGPTSQLVLVLNPFMAVADVLDRQPDQSSGASPFTPMQLLLRERENPLGGFLDGGPEIRIIEPVPGQAVVEDVRRPPADVPLSHRVPLWVESLAAFALLGFAAVALAARRLRLPRRVLP